MLDRSYMGQERRSSRSMGNEEAGATAVAVALAGHGRITGMKMEGQYQDNS